MLMQANNREIEKQEARLKLADLGWSLEELADFGIENIMNPSGTQLFTKLMQTHFPHKTLGEMIELHELLKSPFNLKMNKSEYKRISFDCEKREFLDEIRYEIMVFLIDCLYSCLPVDQRFSYFTAARKVRVTLRELRGLLKR